MAQVSPESVATFPWMAPMHAMHINRSMMSCFLVAPVRRIRKSFATIFNPDSFSFNSSDSSSSISSNDSSFARKRRTLRNRQPYLIKLPTNVLNSVICGISVTLENGLTIVLSLKLYGDLY